MLKKATLLSSFALALPFLASAQAIDTSGVEDIIIDIGRILNLVIPIIIGIALIYFLWGLVQYLKKPDSSSRTALLWGIIILVVMVSVWGLVRIVQNVFDLQNETTAPPAPDIPAS